MRFPELTYANPTDPPLKRWLIRSLEEMSGRGHFAPLYDHWRTEIVPKEQRVISPMLRLIDVELVIEASRWPAPLAAGRPLVLVANHPYGILDGIAALTLAEDLGRPFKILINKDLMKVPEIRPYSLPIDFDETKRAMETNLATRKAALKMLAEGVTIVVFPAGGVATAPHPLGLGRAVDLPWKGFVARLVQSAKASVLPVYFEGQCSTLFHMASHVSLTLRLSLLLREFRRKVGSRLVVRIGEIVPFEILAHGADRRLLTEELFALVHRLSGEPTPSHDGLPSWLMGRD